MWLEIHLALAMVYAVMLPQKESRTADQVKENALMLWLKISVVAVPLVISNFADH